MLRPSSRRSVRVGPAQGSPHGPALETAEQTAKLGRAERFVHRGDVRDAESEAGELAVTGRCQSVRVQQVESSRAQQAARRQPEPAPAAAQRHGYVIRVADGFQAVAQGRERAVVGADERAAVAGGRQRREVVLQVSADAAERPAGHD